MVWCGVKGEVLEWSILSHFTNQKHETLSYGSIKYDDLFKLSPRKLAKRSCSKCGIESG